MPYIPQESRHQLRTRDAQSPGELNFILFLIAYDYVMGKGTSYGSLNEVMGVFECVKQEFYRRVVVPYEEKKRIENGDIL